MKDLDGLIRGLQQAGLEFSAEDLADAFWLALHAPMETDFVPPPPQPAPKPQPPKLRPREAMPPEAQPPEAQPSETQPSETLPPKPEEVPTDNRDLDHSTEQHSGVDAYLPNPPGTPGEKLYGLRVSLPDAAGLPQALAIARALRPLRRGQETARVLLVDEFKTAEQLAVSDIWVPILLPGKERWLSAALVIDTGASMAVWQTLLREFRRVLESLGAFRKLEQWWLDTENPDWTQEPDSPPPLFASRRSRTYRQPLDVVHPSGRQLILVVSDCVSEAWRDGRVAQLLGLWGKTNQTAILQVLPKRMWERTALGQDQEVSLYSPRAACPNSRLSATIETSFGRVKVSRPTAVSMPVLDIEVGTLSAWSQWVAQDAGGILPGRILEADPSPELQLDEQDDWAKRPGQPFLTLASRTARELANIMAVAPPFNLPLLRVIRESMLGGEATQIHEAEFLLGGLVKIVDGHDLRLQRPNDVLYDFQTEELRKLFRAATKVTDALNLLRIEQVSQFLGQHLGRPTTFPAYLASPANYEGALDLGSAENRNPIASFTSDILQWLGDPYARLLRATPTPKLNLKKAFVIQPVGDEAIRKRNDRIFGDLIRPACLAASFGAERADKYSDKAINEPITSPLFGHPLVVADLGNLSSVSPNVMIEAGFRLSTGRPMLFVADAPLPADIPSHLDRARILEVDPRNPRARLNELVSQIQACSTRETDRGKEQGWVSEHPSVDWRWSLNSDAVYLNANDKAAALYGLANVNEIIGHPVEEVDDRLYDFMDPEYREAFLDEQKTIFGRIIASLSGRERLTTGATLPLIFSRHPFPDMVHAVHLPIITNYKYDQRSNSIVFRTIFLRIDEWCARNVAERRIEHQKIPLLFREIYEYDFFLCYDAADFQEGLQLKEILTRSGFSVWWPSDKHNRARDGGLSAVDLTTGLAKSRIAAVLVGAGGRGRWGKGELDDTLYKHCELRKPLVLFLLPGASSLQPDNWLGPRYATLLPDPLYLNWPDNEEAVTRFLATDRPSSFLERILTEVVKLLRLPETPRTPALPESLHTVATRKSDFSEPTPAEPILKKTFVIQSIGEGGTRERNDRVFEDLIRPACAAAGFDAERVNKEIKSTLTEPITSPLFGHPLVVADLGNLSSVSPNVMIEAGFRLATGGPMLFVADAPLPAHIPSHLPQDRERILEVDPRNPRARLNELVSQIQACSTREVEQGWVSEHPWVDWQWSLNSAPVYLNANAKAAALYGLANVNEIIGNPVEEVDNRLYDFMDPEYREAFLNEQQAIFGRIIASPSRRAPLNTGATLPLIFSRHPILDLVNAVHLPIITNYKYDQPSNLIIFRTVFLRIDEWCAKDLAVQRVANRKIPALFREIYEHDVFLCCDTEDFEPARQFREVLTRSGFDVWWPYRASDRELSAVDLKTGLATSQIAVVLVGSRGRGRWGTPELDDALYRHCELRKPLILFLLPGASNGQPDHWLGPRYAKVLPEPLYLNWPDNEVVVTRLLAVNTTPSFVERILREVVKLLRS